MCIQTSRDSNSVLTEQNRKYSTSTEFQCFHLLSILYLKKIYESPKDININKWIIQTNNKIIFHMPNIDRNRSKTLEYNRLDVARISCCV